MSEAFCQSCGKVAYINRAAARKADRAIRGRKNTAPMDIYPCEQGDGFHLASRAKPKPR